MASKSRCILIGLIKFHGLPFGLVVELRLLDRQTHLVADGYEQIDFLGIEFARSPTGKLNDTDTSFSARTGTSMNDWAPSRFNVLNPSQPVRVPRRKAREKDGRRNRGGAEPRAGKLAMS